MPCNTPHAPPVLHHSGKYYKPGTAPGPLDERKLYLHIQGEPEVDVMECCMSTLGWLCSGAACV